MKKYRIVFLIYLLFIINPLSYSQTPRSKLIEILNEYKMLNDSLLINPNTINREKIERYTEKCLHPILPNIQTMVCENHDNELLAIYISTLLIAKNSSDEFPITTFGHIYICKPNMTLEVVRQPEFLQDRSYLLDILEFGLLNAIADSKDIEFDYQELIKRIKVSRQD